MTTVADFITKENITLPLHQKHDLKIGDRVRYTILNYPINEAVQGFIVLKIFGIDSGNNLMFEYEKEGGAILGSADPSRADVYLHGYVKWDGCSNWYFDNQDNCYLHFCGEEEAALLGEIMRTAYKITRDNIEYMEG